LVILYRVRRSDVPHGFAEGLALAPLRRLLAEVIWGTSGDIRATLLPVAGIRFNAPPGWPEPEPGWAPPPGWNPDPSWPPAPDGWRFYVQADELVADETDAVTAPAKKGWREKLAEANARNDERAKGYERQKRWKEEAANRRAVRQAEAGKSVVRREISKVGSTASGVLACPRCGGAQFKAKRSGKAKMIGVVTIGGALLAPKTRVKCVTCGTEYLRG